MGSGASSQDGVPVGMTFFMGSVMLLACAGDVCMLVSGGVRGAKRIARHRWRMSSGLFIAAGSFSWGRQTARSACFRRWGSDNTFPRLFSPRRCI